MILLANSIFEHLHPELKLRAQPTKGAQAPWKPGLPGLVTSARRFIVASRQWQVFRQQNQDGRAPRGGLMRVRPP